MSDYFQHAANRGRPRKDVELDVVEFEPIQPARFPTESRIEVHEHTEGTGEFRRLFAELMEKRA